MESKTSKKRVGTWIASSDFNELELVKARFWSKVDPSIGTRECWEWLGTKTSGGYGNFFMQGKWFTAHRLSYSWCRKEVTEGLTLDHICRNRACVNPLHLRELTLVENVMIGESPPAKNARKTLCQKGHELSGKNLYVNARTGYRSCRRCSADAQMRYRKLKEADDGQA